MAKKPVRKEQLANCSPVPVVTKVDRYAAPRGDPISFWAMEHPLVELGELSSKPLGAFASPSDHAECRRLQQKYGTTYYFATKWLAKRMRRRVHALYGFVRVPDQWMDERPDLSVVRRRKMLEDYRSQLIRGMDGVCPDAPVLRAFCDVIHEVGLPLDEPLLFLDSMEKDLTVQRYATYEDLRGYMRGSAASVGVMMCTILGANTDRPIIEGAVKLGEAMQLTNFLRDVGEDVARGRIYLPREHMDRFGVSEDDILRHRKTSGFIELMRFEIALARSLYSESDAAIARLPLRAVRPVRLARILYSRILDRIESRGYDVFNHRARTSKIEKIAALSRVMLGA